MFAHGIGERGELPISTTAVIWITAGLLVVFFGVVTWRQLQPDLSRQGRLVVSSGSLNWMVTGGRAIGFGGLALCLAAGFFGFNAPDRNLLPVTFYVVVWVGFQLLAALVGDLWPVVNPVASVAAMGQRLGGALGRSPGVGTSSGPTTWGHWPAAAGLLVFLFYELSHPRGLNPRTVAWLLAVHVLIILALSLWWGAAWTIRHEPFTALFATIGSMAPLSATDAEGSGIRARPPLSGVGNLVVRPGTAVLLLVALGGTAFDGLAESELGQEILAGRYQWSLALAEFGMMLVTIAVVVAVYLATVWWAERVTAADFESVWDAFTPMLVPIVVAYAAAHYVQLLYNEIQSFVFRLSDPFGRDWDLIGMSDGLRSTIDPDVAVWIQLFVVLFGHMGALLVARERSVFVNRLTDGPPARSVQVGLGAAFTVTTFAVAALWLLLAA